MLLIENWLFYFLRAMGHILMYRVRTSTNESGEDTIQPITLALPPLSTFAQPVLHPSSPDYEIFLRFDPDNVLFLLKPTLAVFHPNWMMMMMMI